MKRFLIWLTFLVMGSVGVESAVVSGVTLEQVEDTRLVEVGYTIDEPGIVTFQFSTNSVEIAHSESVRTISGSISTYLDVGEHHFYWDAGRDMPECVLTDLTVEVALWSTNDTPLYCAVGLVAQGGVRPIYWYAKESEVPFGVQDSRWKKDFLLLRKIPDSDGSVNLGSPATEVGRHKSNEDIRPVTISKSFYMAIYTTTQRQWDLVKGTRPSTFNHPAWAEERTVECISWYMTRMAEGSTYDAYYDWPLKGHAAHPESFMGRLRTALDDQLLFDLPTEAQWEYACRAGTSTAWNNGTDSVSGTTDPNLSLLGRYRQTGGYIDGTADPNTLPGKESTCDANTGTATVGSYLPNAWGLYDMHGNVREWCLDWFVASVGTLSGVDPKGPDTGDNRVARGGGWNDPPGSCRSATRFSDTADRGLRPSGFRVAIQGIDLKVAAPVVPTSPQEPEVPEEPDVELGEFGSAPVGTFAYAVIPDTQRYYGLGAVNDPEGVPRNPAFLSRVTWIANNINDQRIVFVSHTGDIVDKDNEYQWQVAKDYISLLDGVIPYGLTPGNHDMIGGTGDTTLFQTYFGAENYTAESWYGGTYAGRQVGNILVSGNNANSWQTFSVEGLNFVVLHIECNAPDDVLAWADGVLNAHPNHLAIISTHMYLGVPYNGYPKAEYTPEVMVRMPWKKVHGSAGNTPQQMWEKCFSQHENIFLVVSGDQSGVISSRQQSRGVSDNLVHELMADYPRTSDSSDWLRIYRFIPDQGLIRAFTYSPAQDKLCESVGYLKQVKYHQFWLNIAEALAWYGDKNS